jgi:hypothetical protein
MSRKLGQELYYIQLLGLLLKASYFKLILNYKSHLQLSI